MGWISMPLVSMGGHSRPKAYLDAQFSYAPDPAKSRRTGLRVLHSVVAASTYYAAVERYDDSGPIDVTALICLIRWNPKACDGYVFSYKDMDESMGPYRYACPRSVLDLLTEPANDHASEWRAKCRARLALTSRAKPQNGDRLILAEEITFTDGTKARDFIVVRERNRILLKRPDGSGLYRLSRLMERAWTLVPAARQGAPGDADA